MLEVLNEIYPEMDFLNCMQAFNFTGIVLCDLYIYFAMFITESFCIVSVLPL